MTRYTEAEQENRNFSIEEFVSFANPSKPIPLLFDQSHVSGSTGMKDDKTWFDVVLKTAITIEDLGYSVFPLGIVRVGGMVDEGNLMEYYNREDEIRHKAYQLQYQKVKGIFQPNVALYVPGCFCCGADSRVMKDYKDGKLGFVAPREHLLGIGPNGEQWGDLGECRALPKTFPNWNDIGGKLAVRDVSQIKEDARKYFAPSKEGNFYRILLDLD